MIEFLVVIAILTIVGVRNSLYLLLGCLGGLVLLVLIVYLLIIAMRPGPDPKVQAFIKSLDEPQRALVVVPDPDPLAEGRSLDEWATANAPLTPLWN